MAGDTPRRFTFLRAVIHPSSNWAQCQLTMLIEASTTILHHHAYIYSIEKTFIPQN